MLRKCIFCTDSRRSGIPIGQCWESPSHRVHTEWQPTPSGVHSIVMEKLAQASEGGGCTYTSFHYSYHYVQSCSLRSSWEGRYAHYPLFISTNILYVLCGPSSEFTLLLCLWAQDEGMIDWFPHPPPPTLNLCLILGFCIFMELSLFVPRMHTLHRYYNRYLFS